jgi:hypothetical protein
VCALVCVCACVCLCVLPVPAGRTGTADPGSLTPLCATPRSDCVPGRSEEEENGEAVQRKIVQR